MTVLERVCAALRSAGVRYAIVGGHAVALHGAVRGTLDIDIALNWDLKSLRTAVGALQATGLQSRLPVSADDVFRFRDEYVQQRNLTSWSFFNPRDLSEQVDIIVTYDLKGRRLRRIELASGPVQVLGIRDLIAMKMNSGRPQDLEDAAALEKLA